MAEDVGKIYHPEVIEETPFPGDTHQIDSNTTQRSANGIYSPLTTKDNPLPEKRVAVEVIGSVLNTQSRKILKELELVEHGGIRVGKYQNGVSGEINLTPGGLVARDSAGNPTVTIDGETGNSTFKGELRSGSLITGEIIVGNNNVIIDGANKRILVNDGTNDRVLIGFQLGGF